MKSLLSIVAILLFWVAPQTASAQIAVIANPSVSEASVDAGQAANIYKLNTTSWSGGESIALFDLKSGDSKDAFYAAIGEKPGQLKKVWMRAKLSGEGQPPTPVGSDQEMIQKVSSTPGAIGYVDAANVTDGVKVLATLQ